jgi:hypothetical protein
MGIKHLFSSPKSDGADSSLVRASNWNADHSIDAGTITAAELVAGIAGTLTAASAALGTQELFANEGGTSKKVTIAQIAAYVASAIFVGAKVLASAGQSVGAGAATSFDTVVFDTGSLYSGAHPTRLTAPITGKYVVSANRYDQTGYSDLRFAVNGTQVPGADADQSSANNGMSCTTVVSLTAGQYVEVVNNQSGSHTYYGSAADPNGAGFSMFFLGA